MQETYSFRNSKIQQGNKLSGYWAHIFLLFCYFLLERYLDERLNPQHHNEHLQLAPIGLVSSPSTCQVYVFTGPRVPRSPAGTKNKQWTNRWIAIASTELGLRLFRIKSVHQILTLRYMGLPECGFLSLTQGETYIHKHPHILSVFCQSAPRVRKASPSSSRWNMPPWRFQRTRNRRAGVHKRNDVHPFIHISKPKGNLCVVVPTSVHKQSQASGSQNVRRGFTVFTYTNAD